MKYFKKHKGETIILAIIVLLGIGLQIIVPKIMSRFIDESQSGKEMNTIILCILGYLLVVILNKVAGVAEEYLSCSLKIKATNELRTDVLGKYFSMDMKIIDSFSSGELMTRLDEDVEGVFNYYTLLFLRLGSSVVLLTGALVVIGRENLLLSLLMLVISFITIFVFKKISDFGTKCFLQFTKAAAKFNGILKDKLDNVVELHIGAAEEITIESVKVSMRERLKGAMPANLMYGRFWSVSTIMDLLATGTVLVAAALLWDNGIITLGVAYMLYNYVDIIYYPLQSFRDNFNKLQNAKAQKKRVEEFMKTSSDIEHDGLIIEKNISSITVDNLSFSYNDDKEVLHNISFSIENGDHVGIIGRTGCGKTTLVKLLARLYEYQGGSITINDKDIRKYNTASLRNKMAYCPQESHIIHASLRDNITLFNSTISDEEIINSINDLCLNKWFLKFEHGLDTVLESGSGSVSAGEAQFITVIRLFLKKPDVLILDEISSSIDKKSETELMNSIKLLTEGKTVIMIAHHVQTLQWVDKILVMDNGKIIEQGDREELEVKENSFYRQALENMQSANAQKEGALI